jgi:hypothetical protein
LDIIYHLQTHIALAFSSARKCSESEERKKFIWLMMLINTLLSSSVNFTPALDGTHNGNISIAHFFNHASRLFEGKYLTKLVSREQPKLMVFRNSYRVRSSNANIGSPNEMTIRSVWSLNWAFAVFCSD